RHFTALSRKNTGVNNVFYPLGSCTMKYNPCVNEAVAAYPDFKDLHPYQPEETAQGMLEMLFLMEKYLADIAGLDEISLHPAAGAHGELTALLVIRKHFEVTKSDKRRTVLIPDSAHGTNPASCTFAGFKTKKIMSCKDTGLTDVEDLKKHLGDDTAAIMITNPNTLGLFEKYIEEICRLVHEAGGQVYMDGANLNAIMGITRPGDFGIDVMHFNLHKTFSTPHGCGGPGAGPIGVRKHLAPYLPIPRIVRDGDRYSLSSDLPDSIGQTRAFACNALVVLRAFAYTLSLGRAGIKRVAENAVLNANYLRTLVGEHYHIPYNRTCMHEFIATPRGLKGIKTLDIAKRLIDKGVHPPTVYFPLIVPEAMMIEPTETESKETLDRFASIMAEIAREAKECPEKLKSAPHTTELGRLDEIRAVKQPVLRWVKEDG
ncbi:MAG: aminomethyl-transferring glycine dehydrogenase subunit GcvPB, partial [Planctomycetes bacterium]|nr:aminomethyl-transferring glycine dehydrogenase subunit GcvPB [Planctomycetota bacterium]